MIAAAALSQQAQHRPAQAAVSRAPRGRVPTYNNGSNSNLASDGKRAIVFMPVEALT